MIDYLSGFISPIQYTLSIFSTYTTSQTWALIFDSAVVSGRIRIRFLVYYPTYMPLLSTPATYVYFGLATPPSTSVLTILTSLPNLVQDKSAFFCGMRHFGYKPKNSTSRGIFFEQTWPTPTQSYISLDDQTAFIRYQYLIINSRGCVNRFFPYKHLDTSLSKIVCLA
jgi:hypothetical protein